MEFEFDPTKSQSNKQKHGIDFKEAQDLWVDLDRIEIPARTVDEQRLVITGLFHSKKLLKQGYFILKSVLRVSRPKEQSLAA